MIAEKTIERISLYRRLLRKFQFQNTPFIYSHQLAALAHCTPAQIRRDLMLIGISGSSSKGYRVSDLIQGIGNVLDAHEIQKIALFGVGNLGRALLSYFPHRTPNLSIVAAFDTDPDKVGRMIHGCRTFHVHDFPGIAAEQAITLGIITVPAEFAQETADICVAGGIRGLVNFAPVPLRVPSSITVEHLDMTMALDKVAYFARQVNV